MFMSTSGSQVWLESIYVRFVKSPGTPAEKGVQISESSLVWMINVTLQGSGGGVDDCTVCGTSGSKIFADGMYWLIEVWHL